MRTPRSVIAGVAIVVGALALSGCGVNTIPIPDVAGLDVPVATKQIADVGLTSTQREEASDTVAAGVVVGTNPSAGTDVAKESTVTILVSTGPAEVTVDSTDYTDTTGDSSDTTDYSGDSSDPYANASATYSDYIDRFNADSIAMQVSQSFVIGARSMPGDGTVYCRIGISTQYQGAVIISLYLPVGVGMAFMVPSSGSPVIQGDFTHAPTVGDPCTVSSQGQVSF